MLCWKSMTMISALMPATICEAPSTVTVKTPVAELPSASADVQLTVVTPITNADPAGGEQTTGRAPPTRSIADTPKATTAPLTLVALVITPGGRASAGAVVSTTVMVKRSPSVEFVELVARQPTVVAPSGKVAPDATGAPNCGSPPAKPVMMRHCTGSAPSAKDDAVAVNGTRAPAALVASATMSAGTETTGRSSMITMKDFTGLWLPCASVAWHVTFVDPIGNVEPDDGVHDGVMAPSTLSNADTAPPKVTTAPAALVASWLNGWNGTLRKGALVSCTMIVKLRVTVLPRVSEAEQVTGVGPNGNCDPDGGLQVTGRGPSTCRWRSRYR